MIYLARFILWLLSLMPATMPYSLAGKGAGMWMRLSPVKRHTTERNLERCFPRMQAQEREKLALESFHHYLCSILETGHNWYWPVERLQAQCDEFIGEELALDLEGEQTIAGIHHDPASELLSLRRARSTSCTSPARPESDCEDSTI